MGSLEDAIRKVNQKYKNTPSPLSEIYKNTNKMVSSIPSVQSKPNNPKDYLLGGFKPNSRPFVQF
jgi:hypothetical protein